MVPARGSGRTARGRPGDGFRPHEPAYLYLLHLPGRDVHKIMATDGYEFRIRDHRRLGLVPPSLDAASGSRAA
ncbi:hypothetical protein OF117_15530 [Geodermatophilus sp. YIM 151500]|uniref:hypothetical protein n=1 Tax=Geodermatophilus sp. YIM 151500 TaxID=2984531 RepID=UPI0021E44DBC|nr:hypothetical protein [Geodermatophilus sp. YIM 151500]MCV2490770.1 hypothetical protein [Geodermatophilus sp. YIM 151500]